MSLLNQMPLGVHENQIVIRARIEGLSPRQTIVEVRLLKLGIPDDLIFAATGAAEDSPEYLAAENAIIAYLRGARMIEEYEALDLLNGREV